MILTDEELMNKARNGDLSGISILFDRFHIRIYNFFYQRNRNKSLSEDLTQIVFEKIIKHRDSYNDKKKFVSWIFTIARNVNIDYFRKKKLEYPGNENMEKLMPQAPFEMEENEDILKIRKAITLLSIEDQEIITLTKFQKLKYTEVAEILGYTETAIKVKVHRSIKKLKEVFYKIK